MWTKATRTLGSNGLPAISTRVSYARPQFSVVVISGKNWNGPLHWSTQPMTQSHDGVTNSDSRCNHTQMLDFFKAECKFKCLIECAIRPQLSMYTDMYRKRSKIKCQVLIMGFLLLFSPFRCFVLSIFSTINKHDFHSGESEFYIFK
jgi:hypothetical protein